MKRKLFILLSCLFFVVGCQKETKPQHPLDTHVTLLFFYIQTCSQCHSFQEEAIPYLQDMFGDTLTIHQYDLDDSKTKDVYDKVISSLNNFDQEHYGQGPFYAVDGYFAKLGYVGGDEEEIAKDIQKAVQHQQLGYELEYLRYNYR